MIGLLILPFRVRFGFVNHTAFDSQALRVVVAAGGPAPGVLEAGIRRAYDVTVVALHANSSGMLLSRA